MLIAFYFYKQGFFGQVVEGYNIDLVLKTTFPITANFRPLSREGKFFNKVPFKLINKLFKIVTDHGGEIVNSEESATHIIEYN